MSITIKYTADCDCGERYEARTLDLSQSPGPEVEVNLGMLEMDMTCRGCGDRIWVPAPTDFAEEQ